MSKPLSAPTLDEVIDALDELVALLVRHRLEPDRDRRCLPEVIKGGDLMATSHEVVKAISLVAKPVDVSLKHGMRDLAQLIYDMVGMVRLGDILEDVCKRDRRHEGHRRSILASAFNGVGKDDDRWWS